MIDYLHTMLGEAAPSTVEADLSDWAEQHHSITLPDDEYPYVDRHQLI